MGWRLWQYSPKGEGYKKLHTFPIIICIKAKRDFSGDAQAHKYWLQHREIPEGHNSMKYIALLWDPTPAKIAKRDLPLLPTSSTSHCFPMLHIPNSSHSYLTPSLSQFSYSIVRIPAVGLQGGRRKFSICCHPWQLQGPSRPVHRTGQPSDLIPDWPVQSGFQNHTIIPFLKQALMIPHDWWIHHLLINWNVTKGWMWFVHMKITACFWRVYWGVCTLQKSIRKGEIFVSRSQLPPFLIQQEAGWIIWFWQRAEVCCYLKSIHSLKLY